MPMPPMQGDAGAFMGALFKSGYIYAIAALQVLGGTSVCFLVGVSLPSVSLLLGPVIVNIVLYHIFLDPKRPANGDRRRDSRVLPSLGLSLQISRDFPAVVSLSFNDSRAALNCSVTKAVFAG